MSKQLKLVITCGGTGGHFYPGLALARCAGSENTRLLLSGAHAPEQIAIAAQAGITGLPLTAMPSPGSLRNACRFVYGLCKGVREAKRALREFSPDAVIGMGSFASLPVAWAAKSLKIPLFLHDGNARIGRANRFLSSWARGLGAGFPPVNGDKCSAPIIDCGMPVRPELISQREMSKADAARRAAELWQREFSPDRPVLLVFGGSQGAAKINELVPEAVNSCGVPDIQIIHLTGRGKLESTREAYARCDLSPLLLESTSEMGVLLALADVVVSRSGGSTVAELALFGKAALLIPYPFAAENHQLDNARFYASSVAGQVIEQSELTPDKIAEFLTVLGDPDRLADWSSRAATLGRPRAAEDFLDAIAAAIGK